VYQQALKSYPQEKFDSLNIVSQEYAVKSARGAMYPTLSAFAQIGTNYASTFENYNQTYSPTGKFDTVGTVAVNGTNYYALSPGYSINTSGSKIHYFNQVFNNNLTQAFGITLNIPIASNRQLKTNYQVAKLNLENYKLTRKQDDITLQSNIYLAYSGAVSSLESYNASVKAYETQQYAYDLSKKRYDLGVLSTIDLILTENNLFTAQVNELSARYTYVFRMKILEFYKGQGVKL
jgi:outer membrane protein